MGSWPLHFIVAVTYDGYYTLETQGVYSNEHTAREQANKVEILSSMDAIVIQTWEGPKMTKQEEVWHDE